MEITSWAYGDFCGPELAARDFAGAKGFYTELFGWASSDRRTGGGTLYAVVSKDGCDVGAIVAAGAEGKLSPHWMPYVAVKSADGAARRVVELGGEVRVSPADVADAGRRAVVADPLGARFGLWQPGRKIGSRLLGESGSFCWNELYTVDPARAAAFYGELFGWRAQTARIPSPPYDYALLHLGEIRVAGMVAIPKEWGPVPPHWLVYFAVESCDQSERRALHLGAQSVLAPSDIPNVGRFAILKDPQGAAFAIFKSRA